MVLNAAGFARELAQKARDAIAAATEADQAVTAARSAQATAQKAAAKAAHEAGESLEVQARIERERDAAIEALDELRAPAILDGIHIDLSAERTLARKVDLLVSAAVVAAKRAAEAEHRRWFTTQALGGANLVLRQAEDTSEARRAAADNFDGTSFQSPGSGAETWAEDWRRLQRGGES